MSKHKPQRTFLCRGITRVASDNFGSGSVWWGEATDEPAREDVRPTGKTKLTHYHNFSGPSLGLRSWIRIRLGIAFPKAVLVPRCPDKCLKGSRSVDIIASHL